MARSLNKVMLIGRIQPNDPELRYTQSGQAVCTFKIVTDESYKDKEGTTHERSEWHRVVFWGKAGEIIAQYMKKGRQIYVEGRIQTRQYEQDGQSRYITEVVGNDFTFLDGGGRDDAGGNGGGGSYGSSSGGGSGPSNGGGSSYSDTASAAGAADDDLPF